MWRRWKTYAPNETTMIEVTLDRSVDLGVFRLTGKLEPAEFGATPLLKLLPQGATEEEIRRTRLDALLKALAAAATNEERARIRQELARMMGL